MKRAVQVINSRAVLVLGRETLKRLPYLLVVVGQGECARDDSVVHVDKVVDAVAESVRSTLIWQTVIQILT